MKQPLVSHMHASDSLRRQKTIPLLAIKEETVQENKADMIVYMIIILNTALPIALCPTRLDLTVAYILNYCSTFL